MTATTQFGAGPAELAAAERSLLPRDILVPQAEGLAISSAQPHSGGIGDLRDRFRCNTNACVADLSRLGSHYSRNVGNVRGRRRRSLCSPAFVGYYDGQSLWRT
jgi:hypothetical protein